jgi:NADPH:quinone reductase-like Zn-dependent oxidoreductase
MSLTMRAAVRDRYGPPELVELREVDRPTASADEVLVRVRAASVNRADLDLLYARPAVSRLFFGLRAPRVGRLGCDVAGVVETVGENVTAFRPGDRVFGDMYPVGLGAFAEYVAAPERAFSSIPDEMSFEDAATLPHSATLALNGLRLRNGRTVRPGDRVLIDGASGSVGPFAVQIAKSLGAEVTGVCSTAKVEFVRSLGADHVIDYSKVDYTMTGERFDWILAVDAHHSIFRVRRSLQPNGVYTTLGGSTAWLLQALVLGPLISRAGKRSMGLVYWWRPFSPNDVAALKALVAAGVLTPAIERRVPLDEVVAALRHVEDGRAQGKVVITV